MNRKLTHTFVCCRTDVGCVSIELAENRYIVHVSSGHIIVFGTGVVV